MADAKDQGAGASISDADLKKIHACVDYPLGQDLPSFAAMVTAKKWPNGSTLRVRFLDGEGRILARVLGQMMPDSGRVDLPIGVDWPNRPRQMVDPENGRAAVTDWEVVNRNNTETRIRLSPLTGRSHQLRVHMLSLGHPILGDPIYADDAAAYPRLMLHAETLGLHHPETNAWVSFVAPCPF